MSSVKPMLHTQTPNDYGEENRRHTSTARVDRSGRQYQIRGTDNAEAH